MTGLWPGEQPPTGVPGTYSDVQVLEEDEQCLPDQLELPSRETPIDLPRQGGGGQECQHPPSQVEQILPRVEIYCVP